MSGEESYWASPTQSSSSEAVSGKDGPSVGFRHPQSSFFSPSIQRHNRPAPVQPLSGGRRRSRTWLVSSGNEAGTQEDTNPRVWTRPETRSNANEEKAAAVSPTECGDDQKGYETLREVDYVVASEQLSQEPELPQDVSAAPEVRHQARTTPSPGDLENSKRTTSVLRKSFAKTEKLSAEAQDSLVESTEKQEKFQPGKAKRYSGRAKYLPDIVRCSQELCHFLEQCFVRPALGASTSQIKSDAIPDSAVSSLEKMDKGQALRSVKDPTFVMAAAKEGDASFMVVLDVMRELLQPYEMLSVMSAAIHAAAVIVHNPDTAGALRAITVLLQNGAQPESKDLIMLTRIADVNSLEECFFMALLHAKNSFIPGLNISLAIDDAAQEAQQLERNKLNFLKSEIDKLLDEVLRWLPKTVQGLAGGMSDCAELLEPELVSAQTSYGAGPLSRALRCNQRTVTFAITPLGMDYMLQKFTRGLPGLRDGAHVRVAESPHYDPRDEAKGQESLTALCHECELGRVLSVTGKYLTGGSLYRLSLLPGVHFITTGIAGLPNAYYKVPVMRMVFDLIVYVGVLVLFTKEVLLLDAGPVEVGEVAFAACVVTALIAEAVEFRRDVHAYLTDRWHKLDLLALQICLIAFLLRTVDIESSWGQGLYALGAPLMYWRLLFFAQILRFQGAMVQVVFTMATELLQFGVVMGVVLVGFAVSFFSLFRELDDTTLASALLKVFKAMLGEVGFFDDFTDTKFETVATLLLVLYLVIMTIMLLNLLIAVLSTAHSKVEQSVLIRISRARLFMFYRRVAANDVLPPPFNIVQMTFAIPCYLVDLILGTCLFIAARSLVGRILFWFVMGPFAILTGSCVWLLSLPRALALVWTARTENAAPAAPRILRVLFTFSWCTVGAPLCLIMSWLTQAPNIVSGRTKYLDALRPPRPSGASLERMLKEATGGLGMADVRLSLRDPVSTASHCYTNYGWHDRTSTLEHVKLLGERLESFVAERMSFLQASLEKKVSAVSEERMRGLEEKLDELRSYLEPGAL